MNSLSQSTSPYLLQHKDNPVNWYPWSEEAFSKAATEQKPIFLSIGYSSCYWCHVMAHDSFEDAEVARFLNDHFISIKVDREERPDVDAIYMESVVGLTGHGGWPMSVFLTPEKLPFWGATFFPKDQFLHVLGQISNAWIEKRELVMNSAAELTAGLNERRSDRTEELPKNVFAHAAEHFSDNFDKDSGGFSPAPKFPPSQQIRFLFRAYRREGDANARTMAEATLTHMARGGIFDHLAGGFSRYSTDAKWLVPHFEKMLYDNALLTVAYLEGVQISGNKLFALTAQKTLDYILGDLISPEGMFYSARDAGEVGKEGEYYVWKFSELSQILSPSELELLSNTYQVSESGNFEGNNILHLGAEIPWEQGETNQLKIIKAKLLEKRQQRPAPFLDTKILVDWNALAISALCRGAHVLGDSRYLDAAKRAANAVIDQIAPSGLIPHSIRSGKNAIAGMLDDYAFFIQALLDLFNRDHDSRWLESARTLQGVLDGKFLDSEMGGYFTSIAPDLIVRKREWTDGATPSGIGVATSNLARLSKLVPLESQKLMNQAKDLCRSQGGNLEKYPWAFPSLLRALDIIWGGAKNVCDGESCSVQIAFDEDD